MLLFVIYLWLLWWAIALFPSKWVPVKHLPAVAITIAPFVFYHPIKYKIYNEKRLHNHEMRHIWQQRVLSPAFMLALYILSSVILFIFYLIKFRSLYYAYEKSYWYNPFEVDARNHETIAGHLNQF